MHSDSQRIRRRLFHLQQLALRRRPTRSIRASFVPSVIFFWNVATCIIKWFKYAAGIFSAYQNDLRLRWVSSMEETHHRWLEDDPQTSWQSVGTAVLYTSWQPPSHCWEVANSIPPTNSLSPSHDSSAGHLILSKCPMWGIVALFNWSNTSSEKWQRSKQQLCQKKVCKLRSVYILQLQFLQC